MLKRRVLAERAIVPDYLDQMRIQLLENHNSKLLTDISNLQGEIHTLKQEVSKLSGENPDYIRSLKERVKEYEKREIELKEKILLIAKEAKSSEEELANLNKLLSSSETTTIQILSKAITQVHDRQKHKTNAISFFLGVLASLVAWGITEVFF